MAEYGAVCWWWVVYDVWLTGVVVFIVVAIWDGSDPLTRGTCSSSFQLSIISVGFIVVPPSSWPTSIAITYARSLGIINLAWYVREWW